MSASDTEKQFQLNLDDENQHAEILLELVRRRLSTDGSIYIKPSTVRNIDKKGSCQQLNIIGL